MAYGLRPANTAGAGYHTGGFVEYQINPDEYNTAIFNGSCVTMTAGKGITLLPVPVGNAATTTGVLVGARWTNSEGEIKFGQSYDGNTTNEAGSAYAFVALASDTIFRVQGTAQFAAAQRGTPRTATTGATGSAITGNSNLTCTNAVASAGSSALVVIDVVNDGKQLSSATPDLLVRFASGAIQNLIG